MMKERKGSKDRMTIKELFAGVAAVSGLPAAELPVASITCDSRKVEKDGIFVCIDGTAVDGHRFAGDAVAAGVAAVVAERDLGLPRQILVPSTRLAWAQMSANWLDVYKRQCSPRGIPAPAQSGSISKKPRRHSPSTHWSRRRFPVCGI